MTDIVELAERLGKRIATDPRGTRMASAQRALDASLPDRQLLADYEQHQLRLAQQQMAGGPIEPEDKRKLVELQQKVAGNAVLKELLAAQADLVELLHTVWARVEIEVFGEEAAAPSTRS